MKSIRLQTPTRSTERFSVPNEELRHFSGALRIDDDCTLEYGLVYTVTNKRTGRIAASFSFTDCDGTTKIGSVESGCLYSWDAREKLLESLCRSEGRLLRDEILNDVRGWLETASTQVLLENATP